MDKEEIAFRRAICIDPADDAPRLVFADWLTERGREEEADLIRKMVGDPATRRRLEPLRTDPESWSDVPRFSSCEVIRGFVMKVKLHIRDFLDVAPRLFAIHPVTDMRLGGLRAGHRGRPSRYVVTLAPTAESGQDYWPAAFFPGLTPGVELGFRRLSDLYRAKIKGAVNYGRQAADLPPLR